MMQGMADLAFHRAARVIRANYFQTIGTTVFHFIGKLQLGFTMYLAFSFRQDRLFSNCCRYRLDPGLGYAEGAFFRGSPGAR
jgi:hypothetical protein